MKLMKHVVIIWELDLSLEVNKQNVENYHIWLHLDIVKRLEELNTIVVELWSIGTVASQNIVDKSFPTLVVLVRLSFKVDCL